MVLRAHPLKSEAVVLTTWRKVCACKCGNTCTAPSLRFEGGRERYLGEMESGRKIAVSGVEVRRESGPEPPSGTSGAGEMRRPAQEINPFFWRFHYEDRFESEGSPFNLDDLGGCRLIGPHTATDQARRRRTGSAPRSVGPWLPQYLANRQSDAAHGQENANDAPALIIVRGLAAKARAAAPGGCDRSLGLLLELAALEESGRLAPPGRCPVEACPERPRAVPAGRSAARGPRATG